LNVRIIYNSVIGISRGICTDKALKGLLCHVDPALRDKVLEASVLTKPTQKKEEKKTLPYLSVKQKKAPSCEKKSAFHLRSK